MMNYNTFINKRIPAERWEEFCDTFTQGNRGRSVSIEIVGYDVGDQKLADSVPFSAIDFDTLFKGYAFILSYGSAAPLTTHTIPVPAEVLQTQDENGVVVALEIIDTEDRKTIINFE
jgi:hypothetical protein